MNAKKAEQWYVYVYETNGNPVMMLRLTSQQEAEEAAQRYQLRGAGAYAIKGREQ